MTPQEKKDLSPFAAYWFSFVGYEFKDLYTEKTLSKLQFWLNDKVLAMQLAEQMLLNDRISHKRYRLIPYVNLQHLFTK